MPRFTLCTLSALVIVSLSGVGYAGEGESRFIENEAISTVVGDFDFVKGFPTPETTKKAL